MTTLLSARDTESTVRNWYAAIARGDVAAILAGMAADVEFVLPENEWNRVIDYVGTWRGREAVARAFALRGARNEILDYEVTEIVAGDGLAYVRCFTRARHLATDSIYEVDDVHRVVLDERGEISHWTAFFDPSAEAAAYRHEAESALVAAVRAGNSIEVARLLEIGVSPDTLDADGRPVLQVAAGCGSDAVVAALLAAGADVDRRHATSTNTALHVACQGGHLQVVGQLLGAGADIEATTSTMGHTPLVEAVWYLCEDVVAELLAAGAHVNVVTHYGATIGEHIEAERGAGAPGLEVLERIQDRLGVGGRESGAPSDADALIRAVIAGDTERALRHLGLVPVDLVDPIERVTPLFGAACRGMTEVVVALLEAGADPNRFDPVFLASPMHLAAYNGMAETLRALISCSRADIDLQGPVNGYAPIHDAAFHGQRECVEILAAAGARLDLRGHDGRTPAELVAWSLGADDPLAARLAPTLAAPAAPAG